MPKICILGTCRIKKHPTVFGNHLHTTKEIIQLIELMEKGGMPYEPWMNFLNNEVTSQLEMDKMFTEARKLLNDSSIIFVEISSMKVMRYRDYWLQVYAFSRKFRKRARAVLGVETAKRIWNDMRKEVFLHTMTRGELEKDLTKLHSMLIKYCPKIVYIPIPNVELKNGKIKNREIIHSTLNIFCITEINAFFLDTLAGLVEKDPSKIFKNVSGEIDSTHFDETIILPEIFKMMETCSNNLLKK